MAIKKTEFNDDEVQIFDDAIIYKRGDIWHFRIWLTKEGKYARFSLKTKNRYIAEDKAKAEYHDLMSDQRAGKTYFSKTTKQGAEMYLGQRWKDYEAGLIVKGRYATIHTHLEHWLDFIKRDTKLKELERTDCENYYAERSKTKKNLAISQTTVANEQSTINAMMAWLFKRNETKIDSFDFKKLPRVDRGDEDKRRNTFTDEEIVVIKTKLEEYIAEGKKNVEDDANLSKIVVSYYLLISIITGLRRGEQLQLRWKDVVWMEKNVKVAHGEEEITHSLVAVTVRAETSKVRKTRTFVVKDLEYFDELSKFAWSRYLKLNKDKDNDSKKHFGNTLIFSLDGDTMLTARAIGYHFDKILELAEIERTETRDLVPYSFRHYFITSMINKGATPTQVAEMCGTSTAQIEKTYYHTTEAKMITNALPEFYYKDGVLVPK
jgi:integrase